MSQRAESLPRPHPLPQRLRDAAACIRCDWAEESRAADPQAAFYLSVADLLDEQARAAETLLASLTAQPRLTHDSTPTRVEALLVERFAAADATARSYAAPPCDLPRHAASGTGQV